MATKIKYEIQEGKEWITCKKAVTEGPWLRYELSDGTLGLKRPGTWREKEKTAKK